MCPCPTLRGSGLNIWRHLGEDEAGSGELTFSSGLTRKRAHGSVLGLAWGQSLLKETTNGQKKPYSPDSCFLKANWPQVLTPSARPLITPCCAPGGPGVAQAGDCILMDSVSDAAHI